MSTIDTSPDALTVAPSTDRVATTSGVAHAVRASDHKIIGRLLFSTALAVGLAVTVLGALLGIERIDADGTFLDAAALPQLFTAFRFGLVYGLAAPLLLGVAVAIVPLQVGARALAFPRLAAAGAWTWFAGLILVTISLIGNGGPLGGNADMVDLFIAAHGLVVIGLGAIAVALATTVLTSRAPGMRVRRIPFFSWSVLVAGIGLLLFLPVVLGDVIYLFVDHRNGRALFGGNAGIGPWLSFAWTQPAIYLFALPALGLLAELAPVTFAKRAPMRIVGYVGLALAGAAALGAVSQRAHLVDWADDTGAFVGELVLWAFFLGLPLLGAVVVFGLVALIARPDGRGVPRVSAPFALAVVGAGMVVAGMLAAAANHLVDLGLLVTAVEEAATVYVVYGAVLAGLGAIAYWTPVWTGRLIADKQALGLAALGLLATVLASLPYVVAGIIEDPSDGGAYGPSGFWSVLVALGHALMALTVVAFIGLLLQSLRRGEDAGDDPWRAHTLEWKTTLPAPADNFVEPPTVKSPEPVYDLRAAPSFDGKDA